MDGRGQTRRALVFGLGLLALVAVAWIGESVVAGRGDGAPFGAPSPRTYGSPDAPGDGYSVAVFRDDAKLRSFTIGDLEALPREHVTIDGKTQDGPTLPTVLTAAGVTGYAGVDVRGVGLRDDGKLNLTAEQAGAALLDFADRGTVKICSPRIAWDDWVRDVTEIRVR